MNANLAQRNILLFESLLLIAAFSAIYTPWEFKSLLLIPALAVTWYRRSELSSLSELKQPTMWLVAWVVMFSVISTDPSRSLKGAYDMVRGALVIFPALLLGARLHQLRVRVVLLWSIVLILVAHLFFFRHGVGFGFFGFHENPNNVAVSLVAYGALLFAVLPSTRPLFFVWAVAIMALLVFVALANSRGAWLGLGASVAVWLLLSPVIHKMVRVASGIALAVAMAVLFVVMNHKGFGDSYRVEIWLTLFMETLSERPFLGFGLNTVKDIAVAEGLDHLGALTAHNIFLEVLVSSGMLGLAWFCLIVWRLAKSVWGNQYEFTPVWWAGVLLIVAFVVMGQFDLKLSSFRFVASISLGLGLILSHKRSSYGKLSSSIE